MDEATLARLLPDVKNALDISWNDEGTDRKLRTILTNGVAYLDDKLGDSADYLQPGYPRALLFEYARYARDAALDVFENNYQSLILAMQNNRKVMAYELESTQAARPYDIAEL